MFEEEKPRRARVGVDIQTLHGRHLFRETARVGLE
jgi:hypothetical protein